MNEGRVGSVRFETVPDGRMLLPAGWRPPTPFKVRVYYWNPDRKTDVLWLMPYVRQACGRVVFLATGPAGLPIEAAQVRHVDQSRVPDWARVQIVTDLDVAGRAVFGHLNHTMN